MKIIGLDAGSVGVKLAALDADGRRMLCLYQRHRGQPVSVAYELLRKAISDGSAYSLAITGSAGRLIAAMLGIEPVNEVVALAYATRRLFPDIRTIIELGGEDSKLILLGDSSDSARDFSMNSVCAAGTGSFLDQQAERLRLSIEEFAELSLSSKKPPRIAGRCSVFAKSDMIHLQQIATPVEDIVAGLCFAVARNFKGSIARGRTLEAPYAFFGGVAANQGMVRAFRDVLGIDRLFVPEEHALMGAIGAALKMMDSGRLSRFDLSGLDKIMSVSSARPSENGYAPLIMPGEDFYSRHGHKSGLTGKDMLAEMCRGRKITAYLGVDIGSISTNLAVIDEDARLLAKRYLMTAGRPIEAVRQGLAEIAGEIGDVVEIAGVGTTGSGRYMIADYIGADIVKNEITAQATAAAFIDKDVDTIFEIGGQDSKYISLRDGVIVDFEMNKACAAGTGSFLEEQAEKLNVSVKNEFSERACSAEKPCRLGERCTVFMENSLMANLQRGSAPDDLLAGLSYSIVQNYINRVVCKRPIGEKIFFQGGVAFNHSVVAAFEKYLGRKITVPPDHDVTGAIGMALLARQHMQRHAEGGRSGFKGFGLAGRPYELSSFECRGCPNVCEINRVRVEGEKGFLFYGGRCEKYDVRRKRQDNGLPDLFSFRENMLWKEHERRREGADGNARLGRLGLPYIFYFQDYLPFWTALLWELGFDVEVSPKTDRSIVDLGLEHILSETCFPVKTAHGHIRYLLDKGIENIFLPSFVNLNGPESAFERGYACPYTQTIPYSARIAFREARLLSPVIDQSRGDGYLHKELLRIFKPFGVRNRDILRALGAAQAAQLAFTESVRAEGRRILSELTGTAIVIVGRAYNAFDRGMNLDIPRKLADLGVISIPMDFLPIEESDIETSWPNMYWRSGQKILSSARLIRSNPNLYAVYIGNFSCGPDSFIIKFFEQEMSGKPYLHLEIDAHSADAGAVTRCEAFLDSIGNLGPVAPLSERPNRAIAKDIGIRRRKVYIPRMSDHAFALAAAFEYCGVDAEVLPASTKEAVDLGRKYVSGKECYPCAVTTGDMVRKIMEPGFDPSASAFFMPSGTGPCRFGQYNVFHRMVVGDMGYADMPIFAPNQDENFYQHLGIVGKDFTMRSWEGIIATELLIKCLHETRPYEREPGLADRLYAEYLGRLFKSVRGSDGGIRSLLDAARADFEMIRTKEEARPLIGVVGEIFVRSNRFSNEELIRKIEALGGEAYLAPVEEWIYYVNHIGARRLLIKKKWSGIFNLLLKRFIKKRIEHSYARRFEGFLKNGHEPDTKDLLAAAHPYIHPSFEGETILSVGKSIDLIRKGASGIINAMPFGCMPGTIVSGMMRGLSEDFGMPALSIPYDGTESLTMEIQLEAFMDQAKEYRKNSAMMLRR